MIELNDNLLIGYFKRLIGEEGILLIKNMPDKEITDEEIYEILNPLIKEKKDLENENLILKNKMKIDISEETKNKIITNENEIKNIKEKLKNKKEITLNNIRKILFILYENKYTICKRERDTNSGWLTFKWKLNITGIKYQLEREKKKLYKNLIKRKEYEEKNIFYSCPNKCLRLIFDEATESDFRCPICGSSLSYEDNKQFLDILNTKIKKFET